MNPDDCLSQPDSSAHTAAAPVERIGTHTLLLKMVDAALEKGMADTATFHLVLHSSTCGGVVGNGSGKQ